MINVEQNAPFTGSFPKGDLLLDVEKDKMRIYSDMRKTYICDYLPPTAFLDESGIEYAATIEATRDALAAFLGASGGGGGVVNQGAKRETVKNDTYPSSGTPYTINTQGAQNLDLTSNCSSFAATDNTTLYDAVNDKFLLTEGKYYSFKMNIKAMPTGDQNKITFALRKVSNNDTFNKTTDNTVRIGLNSPDIVFSSFVANASHADGIKVFLTDFQGGTGFKLYNIQIELIEA